MKPHPNPPKNRKYIGEKIYKMKRKLEIEKSK